MIFASNVFLYLFLPLFLALYYLTPRKGKSFVIAFASYIFYGWWRPDFVLLMLASTVVDFVCGNRIYKCQEKQESGKKWLLLSLCVNLGLLAYFKYANFGIDTLNVLLLDMGFEQIDWTEVVLPIGISFYTFQTISYSVDIFAKRTGPVRNFRDFMCYVALFPQLIAGPIVRYHTIADQLHSRSHTVEKFYRGVLFFQSGMVKKVLIADIVGMLADAAFANGTLTTTDAWIGIVAYSFQIYFDFSGYSDMAVGLGLMMGFRFPMNFNQPYRSISITDFWRRWHISLSAFLRDYLYIPLGGNKKGAIRTYVNLALTMLLGGLWHGANWTFVAWGAYQAFFLCFERLTNKKPLYHGTPYFVQVGITFVLALFGWVFFRSETIGAALVYFQALFGFGAEVEVAAILQVRLIHMIALAVGACVIWGMPTTQQFVAKSNPILVLALQPVFLVSLLQLQYVDHVPFLYFQF